MDSRVAFSALLVGSIAASIYILKPIHIVRLTGFRDSLYWTFHSWLRNYPLTKDYTVWALTGDPANSENFVRDTQRSKDTWEFIRPFFASRGYDLYARDANDDFVPSPSSAKLDTQTTFPYAQCFGKDDMNTFHALSSFRVCPARDRKGREVMIKAISGLPATNELEVLRFLHSDAARNDPRNHTIPVIDYIEFNHHVFVVMPRWDMAAHGDFVNAGELTRYGRAFFEAITFLHEKNITHGDILTQNMVMDVLLPESMDDIAGVRGPERRYAFIDFETSIHWPPACAPGPFKRDVRRLASQLEIQLRCMEDILPAIGPLFDSMKELGEDQPSASAALARYVEVCSTLSAEECERVLQRVRWREGRITYRKDPPLHIQDIL